MHSIVISGQDTKWHAMVLDDIRSFWPSDRVLWCAKELVCQRRAVFQHLEGLEDSGGNTTPLH